MQKVGLTFVEYELTNITEPISTEELMQFCHIVLELSCDEVEKAVALEILEQLNDVQRKLT